MSNFESYLEKTNEIGFVEQVFPSLVYVNGLPQAKPREVVLFESGEVGYVLSLTKEYVEVVLLSKSKVSVGTKVVRTDQSLRISVKDELLGKTLDPLGKVISGKNLNADVIGMPLDGKSTDLRDIEVVPLGISYRRNIKKPFETGVTLVDMIVPLGMGQRELVVGDRKTGKTQFLLQCVYTQAQKGTVCVYAAIAKKQMDIIMIENFFRERGIKEMTIIVATGSSESPGLVFLTPYTAMTIAEYFRDRGKDVLVIMDDLSAHAKYYREITLLAKRFPGRSSYPGDIFYTHSRLLERAGNFVYQKKDSAGKMAEKEVSITCLPVAELVLSDFSGYIQTNLMAMTDGHIFFDSDMYNQGRRPAINTFLSVTRVGRQAQSALMRDINRHLTSFLVSLDKLKEFLHFGAELSEETKRTLALGDRILTFFDQKSLAVVPININIVVLAALWAGFWKETSASNLKADIKKLVDYYQKDNSFKSKIDSLVTSFQKLKGLVEALKQNDELIFNLLTKKDSL